MNRGEGHGREQTQADPRTSGDEPFRDVVLQNAVLRSPHERG